MKDKRYKHVEDIIEDYIQLKEEQAEIPLTLEKANKKWDAIISDLDSDPVDLEDAEDAFKSFLQVKKCEERREENRQELNDVEASFKEFLSKLNGKKVAFEKRDAIEKMKITYLFWYQDNQIHSNRQV